MGWYVFGANFTTDGVSPAPPTPPIPTSPVVITLIESLNNINNIPSVQLLPEKSIVNVPEPAILSDAYPKIGDRVIRVGEILFLNWNNVDLSNVNVIFFKGNEKIPLINKEVIDGQNSFNIFIDNSYFTEEFASCHIRLEMKENSDVYIETPIFKVLRSDDKGA